MQKIENKDPSMSLKKTSKPWNEKEKKNQRKTTKQPQNSNKMAISTYLSIITLNVNGLNVPIKRHDRVN